MSSFRRRKTKKRSFFRIKNRFSWSSLSFNLIYLIKTCQKTLQFPGTTRILTLFFQFQSSLFLIHSSFNTPLRLNFHCIKILNMTRNRIPPLTIKSLFLPHYRKLLNSNFFHVIKKKFLDLCSKVLSHILVVGKTLTRTIQPLFYKFQ